MTLNHTKLLIIPLLLAALLPVRARAEEIIRAMVTLGAQRVFEEIEPAFVSAFGQKLQVEFASTADIVKRVHSGEAVDFVIISRAGVDSLMQSGELPAGNDIALFVSPIAVAVPAGYRKPDISTVQSCKDALLAARTISFTDPASGGPSGVHLAKVLERLGIADQVRAKTIFPPPEGPWARFSQTGTRNSGFSKWRS